MSDTTRATEVATRFLSARVALAVFALACLAQAGSAQAELEAPQSGDAAPEQAVPQKPVAPETAGTPVTPEGDPGLDPDLDPGQGQGQGQAEEQEPPRKIEPIRPLGPLGPAGEPEGAQAELQRLFVEVERNLRKIDDLLWDASAGDGALGADVDSGIAKLLQNSREASRQVTESIDRILEVATSQSGGGSGCSLGPPPPPQQGGGDPGEKQRQDGEVPGQEEGEKPPGEEPGGEAPGGKQPEGGEEEQDQSDANEAAGGPNSGELQPVGHGDEAERWGELPLRVREVFRAEGSEEMPTRYRDWIDTYYRRLGQER